MTNIDVKYSSSTIVVGDLEKSAAFYKAVCGLTEMARMSDKLAGRDFTEILFNPDGDGATFVLLHYWDEPAPAVGEAMNVFSTDDLEAFVERAGQHGAAIVEAPTTNAQYGVSYAFFKDPEGHLIGGIQVSSSTSGGD